MNKLFVFTLFIIQPFLGYVQENETDHPWYKEFLEVWIGENDELVFQDLVQYYDTLTLEEKGSFSTEIRCPKDIVKEGATYIIPDTNFTFYIVIVNPELGKSTKIVTGNGEIGVTSYSNSEITLTLNLTEPSGRVINKTLTFRRKEY